ncbi:MAG: hypothetical protein U9N84_15315 [Actinomycetota bacterium]|nr:hypothetical protein [Actinomycetota bacterium]
MDRAIHKAAAGFLVLFFIASGCSAADTEIVTSSPAPLASVLLGEDGLGDVLLGFPPAAVIAEISALFGEPDLDSEWIVSEPNLYGSCPGVKMRAIGWGSLVTIFVNDGTDPLGERFYTYTYGYDYPENEGGVDPRGLALSTEAGLGLGESVADLEDAYGSNVVISGDAALDVWSFTITGSPLQGLLTGPDPGDTVTLIELSPGCG